MTSHCPLLPNTDPNAIVACRGSAAITQSQFLHQVHHLAQQLPDTHHVLNLCKDRYWFAVTLMACISRHIMTMLPHSAATDIIRALTLEYPDMIAVGDHSAAAFPLPYVAVGSAPLITGSLPLISPPTIPFDLPVIQVYTSGSTGTPCAHRKTFGRLVLNATAEAKRVWAASLGPCTVLGTVPFQHMYGLESTVFLPLFGAGQLSSPMPLFPADIADALLALPTPRLLVTTPFHLQKLLDAKLTLPPLAAITSATAPLAPPLAQQAEQRFGAPVIEIYGSTETGQIATRQPSQETRWRLHDGLLLSQNQGTTTASGGHLEGPQTLSDQLELHDAGYFTLHGRPGDMINIVGKRSSLSYLNHMITTIPGVRDGVFFLPDADRDEYVTRLAAFLVAPHLTPSAIHAALLQKIDAVFLPRPMIFLEALPRDGNGKISASALSDLISQHLS